MEESATTVTLLHLNKFFEDYQKETGHRLNTCINPSKMFIYIKNDELRCCTKEGFKGIFNTVWMFFHTIFDNKGNYSINPLKGNNLREYIKTYSSLSIDQLVEGITLSEKSIQNIDIIFKTILINYKNAHPEDKLNDIQIPDHITPKINALTSAFLHRFNYFNQIDNKLAAGSPVIGAYKKLLDFLKICNREDEIHALDNNVLKVYKEILEIILHDDKPIHDYISDQRTVFLSQFKDEIFIAQTLREELKKIRCAIAQAALTEVEARYQNILHHPKDGDFQKELKNIYSKADKALRIAPKESQEAISIKKIIKDLKTVNAL